MRILLSGSHGLIARALRTDLESTGHQVVALVRAGPRDAGDGSVAWEPSSDRLDADRLRALGPYDAVVHLAGAPLGNGRWTARRREAIVSSRVDATRTLVTALTGLDPAPGVLVGASAVGYYGDRGDEELTEGSAPGTGFLADLCRRWEDEAHKASAGMRVVRLRSGIVLSTRGGALARQLPLFRLGLGGRLGSGRQYLPWITIGDEVAVIRRALDDGSIAGPVNSVAPGQVTNAGFTAALARALRRPAGLAVPRPALAAALGGDLTDQLLLASQRVVPAVLDGAGHHFADPDIDGALRRLLATGS